MSADILITSFGEGDKGYFRTKDGLLVPAITTRDFAIVIGKIVGDDIIDILSQSQDDVGVADGETAVIIPLSVFDSAVRDRASELAAQRLYLPGK
ncbi:MAG: hypothetical protein ACQR33_00235 [Candidatus Saccharibacteria bacterium]